MSLQENDQNLRPYRRMFAYVNFLVAIWILIIIVFVQKASFKIKNLLLNDFEVISLC